VTTTAWRSRRSAVGWGGRPTPPACSGHERSTGSNWSCTVTGHPAEPVGETRRVAWLAAYDEALASRKAPPGGDGAAADDLAVLHLLDQLRPPRPSRSPANVAADRDARYVLRGLHAEGGIGQIWLAFDNELGREVALKA